ncbi:MAG: UvrD-helicase domain-containing protein, partial [Desulfovibrio sp.]|nr:UvrD-helicase domain-containing protein [Desulfovibrio sp.]
MRKARFRQIKASAGSGKTYNLIREYMSLIARCAYDQARGKGACVSAGEELATYGMNEILAITFTNAAAGEMRGRVIAELKKAALGEDGANADFPPKLAALWLDKIIRELRCLNIRTIDSLMNNIARASALELGLNPDFRPEYAGGKAL